MNETGIRWRCKTIHIDIDTAEIITKHNAHTNYIWITTNKKSYVNKQQTKGTIEYTKLCRRNPQTTLF